LLFELHKRGLKANSQVEFPIVYENVKIDIGYRIDILVEDEVIVELKSVAEISNLHKAQLISYLKLNGKKLGLLINFNTLHLKDGIVRMVNGL
jgi:GxxExxY protein